MQVTKWELCHKLTRAFQLKPSISKINRNIGILFIFFTKRTLNLLPLLVPVDMLKNKDETIIYFETQKSMLFYMCLGAFLYVYIYIYIYNIIKVITHCKWQEKCSSNHFADQISYCCRVQLQILSYRYVYTLYLQQTKVFNYTKKRPIIFQ